MRRTLIVTTIATLFLFAGLSTVVEAQEPTSDRPSKEERKESAQSKMQEKRDDAQEKRDEAQAKRAEKMEKRMEAHKARFFEGNVSLSLSGSGIGRDNATYTFTIEADGKALGKLAKDNSTAGYRGVVAAHGVFMNETGAIVKEGDFRLKVLVHQNDDGNWTWKVVSFGHRDNGMPRLMVRGVADETGEGAFDLSGKGHAVLKLEEDKRATPIKITEASGSLTLPVKPVPAAAAPAE